ncbi:signal transduction protein [uncultured Sphingomonas sp.]|uniref:EF-hand domain-containing protein n=1 Tax=uncultured Sphingomonas sp. TaxID=158754 RepID=UPI0026051631|nr:signal transduction protein [uncultured Sphingomonas sp.]
MKIAPLAALIAFLVAPAAVIAQAPPMAAAAPADASSAAPPAEGGSMTLAQFQARNAARMMAADTDGDGRISLAEWTAQMSGRRGGGGGFDPAAMFARMDANHDGVLDKSEIDAASAERFRRMDTNGDGVITPDERMAARGGAGRHAGRGGRGDAPSTPPPATGSPQS